MRNDHKSWKRQGFADGSKAKQGTFLTFPAEILRTAIKIVKPKKKKTKKK